MEQGSETVPLSEENGICLSCNKRKEKIVTHSETAGREQDHPTFEKEKGSIINPFSSKLQNFKQIFDGPKNVSNECLEKKGKLFILLSYFTINDLFISR